MPDSSPSDSSPSDGSPSDGSTTSRRSFLAATGVAATTAVTGCTAALDFLGDRVLGHVNVFNDTDQRVAGSVTVSGPGGETRLDDTFDLISSQTESGDGQSAAVFQDVWGEAGSYEASVELDDVELDGESAATGTVEIADTGAEKLAVVIGTGTDDPIDFLVGEKFSDFLPTATTDAS